MSKKKETEEVGEAYLAIHLLVDRSGSMGQYGDLNDEMVARLRSEGHPIGKTAGQVREALNALIGSLQSAFMPPHLGIDMFSTGRPQSLIDGRTISEVPLLKPGQYHASGGTATSSAILHGITRLDAVKAGQKVLVILTDGADGERGEGVHTKAQAEIADRLAKGWAVIVMATQINPNKFADSFGIPRDTAIEFTNNIPAAMRAVAHLCLRAGQGKPAFTKEERAEAKKKA